MILTALCGHGFLDLPAYDVYLHGNLKARVKSGRAVLVCWLLPAATNSMCWHRWASHCLPAAAYTLHACVREVNHHLIPLPRTALQDVPLSRTKLEESFKHLPMRA